MLIAIIGACILEELSEAAALSLLFLFSE